MSLYQHPGPYAGYTNQGQAVGYGGYPPQPHQAAPMDPHTFRQFFSSQLAHLNFNSRPIIQNLSMIAQEYARMSHVVVQCIEAHIRMVPASVKLPALYLMDAISKNIYNPYASAFSQHVDRIFIDAYDQVDSQTRGKMEEMLWTWRTGSPTRKELFGVVPQHTIENHVKAKRSSLGSVERAPPPQPRAATRSQVLTEIDVLLALKEQFRNNNPYDEQSASHIEVLRQLKALVQNSTVSQVELSAIMTQLQSLNQVPSQTRPTVSQAVAGIANPGPSVSAFPPVSNGNIYHANVSPVPTPPFPVPFESAPRPQVSTASSSIPRELRAFLGQLAPTTSAPVQSHPEAPLQGGAGFSNLLSSLVKAGVVQAPDRPRSGTPLGAGRAATSTPEKVRTEDQQRIAMLEYMARVRGIRLKLTNAEISRQRPQILPFLYDRQPAQCKQCAIRFPESLIGKKQMDNHLDMHFRQNRRVNQNVGRGHSRSWFIGVDNWIHDVSETTKGNVRDGANASKTAAAEAAEREARLRKSFVVIPPGDEAKPISCPICKETIMSEFLEEEEDWVWRNAVNVQGKIYHATCHADASVSANPLVARLRQQAGVGGVRSRSGTPEPSSQKYDVEQVLKSLEPRTAGLKRKVDDDRADIKQEPDGTPPSKKLLTIPSLRDEQPLVL
ncbi:hypothetical protein SISSUDRAFT_1043265 [Sistotremastrum suecicum HHB10207 ss-3]|uniref:CID domain-containing protein n=1 Tax=Sistotremastrum suecicum HHB10207 ss-3 TaxID=1314776 RepID=A0A166G0B2_9AGAM|nr:hypothetical protein SISSUDRAFT_1043265 [Sistotremastrum suecicum HHB10207 ss-3]